MRFDSSCTLTNGGLYGGGDYEVRVANILYAGMCILQHCACIEGFYPSPAHLFLSLAFRHGQPCLILNNRCTRQEEDKRRLCWASPVLWLHQWTLSHPLCARLTCALFDSASILHRRAADCQMVG